MEQRKKYFRREGANRPLRLVYVRLLFLGAIALCTAGLLFRFHSVGGGAADLGAGILAIGIPILEKKEEVDVFQLPAAGGDIPASTQVALLPDKPENNQASAVQFPETEPKILIYHTHTTEAYSQTERYQYAESGDWRTHDNTRNVVAVGEKLASLLREKYGIPVLHDTTDHEPPKLATSYSRSVVTMEQYREKYPSLEIYIDLHRDAYMPKGENTDYVIMDGERCARMMFVVGTGKGASGNGFSEMPDFDSNYALANTITEYLLKKNKRLMREIRVKTGRYNQHVAKQCLLVEVGHNANTLEEALHAVDYLAEAIAAVVHGSVPLVPNEEQLLPFVPKI